MSFVPITVELPQYAQTFIINLPTTGTVRDIKQEISRACPGNPHVDGQRLVSKGRILDDAERVESLWVTEEEARVVHLAVNPCSWSTNPPEVLDVPSPVSPSNIPPAAPEMPRSTPLERLQRLREVVEDATSRALPRSSTVPPSSSRFYDTLTYIQHIHSKALHVLSSAAPLSSQRTPNELNGQRELAKSFLQGMGRGWPTIFDEDYPPSSEGGVTYECTMIGGKPFLQILTAHAIPTPRQQHALNVLAYTFPLLSLPNTVLYRSSSPSMRLPLANFNNPGGPFANQNGIAAVRVGAEGRGVGGVVRIPVRAVLTPLLFLVLRTLLLLYFFSPARKPVFGLLLGAWVLYEAWGAVRGAIVDNIQGNGNRDAARPPGAGQRADGVNGANERPVGVAFPPHQNPGRTAVLAASSANAVLARLSQLNLTNEVRALDGADRALEPGLFAKAWMFVILLLLTLHPAFWNRRRAALKAREGRVRTEANAREAAVAAQGTVGGDTIDERARSVREHLLMQHDRRPAWVQEYVERVRRGDWVDD